MEIVIAKDPDQGDSIITAHSNADHLPLQFERQGAIAARWIFRKNSTQFGPLIGLWDSADFRLHGGIVFSGGVHGWSVFGWLPAPGGAGFRCMDENEIDEIDRWVELVKDVRLDSVLIAQELFASLLPRSLEQRKLVLEEVRERAKLQTENGSTVVGEALGLIADRLDR